MFRFARATATMFAWGAAGSGHQAWAHLAARAQNQQLADIRERGPIGVGGRGEKTVQLRFVAANSRCASSVLVAAVAGV